MYPDVFGERPSSCTVYDYDPILKSFGDILAREDEESYHGDSWVLYGDGPRIGYLEFGWGSCSGCDALQACGFYEEVDELIGRLRSSIRWFASRPEALEWFRTHDWAGDWSSGRQERDEFVRKAITLLSEDQPA